MKSDLSLRQSTVESTVQPPTDWTVDCMGNIRFTLISNGFTCEQWEQHLERRGWKIDGIVRQILRMASAEPTNGVTYNIVVRRNASKSDRITKKIYASGEYYGWVKPHWEVACLIRDTFTDEQLEKMRLWYIVTMHEPIESFDDQLCLLVSNRRNDGRWINACSGRPDDYWGDGDGGGFTFEVPHQPVAEVLKPNTHRTSILRNLAIWLKTRF